MIQRITLVVVVMVMISACSDPLVANEANIRKAINEYLKSNKLCTASNKYLMPAQIKLSDKKDQEILDVLVQSGLLIKNKTTEKIRPTSIYSAIGGEGTKEELIFKYELSDIGKQSYKTQSDFIGSSGMFCYGYAQVEKIESFTAPADLLGKKITEVSYTYKISEHAKWIESEIFKEDHSVVKNLNSDKEPIKGKTTLLLTNTGWKQPDLL